MKYFAFLRLRSFHKICASYFTRVLYRSQFSFPFQLRISEVEVIKLTLFQLRVPSRRVASPTYFYIFRRHCIIKVLLLLLLRTVNHRFAFVAPRSIPKSFSSREIQSFRFPRKRRPLIESLMVATDYYARVRSGGITLCSIPLRSIVSVGLVAHC